LNEKGSQTEGYCASNLSTERLSQVLKEADLLVNWMYPKDLQPALVELHEEEIQSVLSYLEGA
jgi:trans-aconitate methyltransferase